MIIKTANPRLGFHLPIRTRISGEERGTRKNRREVSMKPFAVLAVLIFSLAVPSFLAGQSTSSDYTNNHVEIGTFADYFRLSRTTPNINFVGVGGRAGFNV